MELRRRIIPVRDGRVVPSSAWVYAWLDRAAGRVAYVGASGIDPELRTHLHLTSDDPDVGRVRRLVPRSSREPFDVVAYAVPPDVDRATARDDLVRALVAARLMAGEPTDADDLPDFVAAVLDDVRALLEQDD